LACFQTRAATNLHHAKADDKTIQAILRHSNISVTQNIYIKSIPADVVNAIQQYENLLSRLNCARLLS
jgi:integrase